MQCQSHAICSQALTDSDTVQPAKVMLHAIQSIVKIFEIGFQSMLSGVLRTVLAKTVGIVAIGNEPLRLCQFDPFFCSKNRTNIAYPATLPWEQLGNNNFLTDCFVDPIHSLRIFTSEQCNSLLPGFCWLPWRIKRLPAKHHTIDVQIRRCRRLMSVNRG